MRVQRVRHAAGWAAWLLAAVVDAQGTREDHQTFYLDDNSEYERSNYFIGYYDANGRDEVLPYPPGVCSSRGALADTTVLYTCLNENLIQENIYDSGDLTCLESDLQSSTEYDASQADFNCSYQQNYQQTFVSLNTKCRSELTRVNAALDICFWVGRRDTYSFTECNETHSTTYYTENPDCTPPWTSTVATTSDECLFLEEYQGLDIFGKLTSCTIGAIETLQTEDSSDSGKDCSYFIEGTDNFTDYVHSGPLVNLGIAVDTCTDISNSWRWFDNQSLIYRADCERDPPTAIVTVYELDEEDNTDELSSEEICFVDSNITTELQTTELKEYVDQSEFNNRDLTTVYCTSDAEGSDGSYNDSYCDDEDYSLIRVYQINDDQSCSSVNIEDNQYENIRIVTNRCLRRSRDYSMKTTCKLDSTEFETKIYYGLDCDEKRLNYTMQFGQCVDPTNTYAYQLLVCSNGAKLTEDEEFPPGLIAALVIFPLTMIVFCFFFSKESRTMGECWERTDHKFYSAKSIAELKHIAINGIDESQSI